jgi:hypothetical protein
MALLLHVVIAILSLVFSAYLYFSPTRAKLRVSYGLMALTVGSGTYLVAASQGHILETCLMGLLYLGLTILGVLAARRKLATSSHLQVLKSD